MAENNSSNFSIPKSTDPKLNDTTADPHHQEDQETTVGQLRNIVQQFVDERDWRHFHNAKNLSMSLAIEAGELMEHFQWLTTEQVVDGDFSLSEVRDELADVACYALAISNALEIDLSSAIKNKMVKNRIKYPAEKSR